ncbi:hypothetical protein RvY_07953 [Ramazzottius varieornatus]|uniref:Serine/arginine-rich splicing factor 2 n=1 Tax=Ramazzottius varieornatus TaxID=947166 RepID=A0A1D1V8Y8_RAMVA|nr:hypothetical protein RvY_07953 [Ramazzottius varieornatus]
MAMSSGSYPPVNEEWLEDDCGTFDSPPDRAPKMVATKVIVNYLPSTYRERDLRFLFDTYTRRGIKDCRVVLDQSSGESLRYGFVEFEDAGEAQMSVDMINGLNALGSVLQVASALPQSIHPKSTTLFIKNIPANWRSNELAWFFSKFGPVVTSKVLCYPLTGDSRQIGFVGFQNRANAERAIAVTHKRVPYPGRKGVAQQALIVEFARSNLPSGSYRKSFLP